MRYYYNRIGFLFCILTASIHVYSSGIFLGETAGEVVKDIKSTEIELPKLEQRITDNAAILSAEANYKLRKDLKQLEGSTSAQLAILTIKSLKGESIEYYANQVFNKTRLGQSDKDNGVLIVFAKEDRKVRIEVGYGLEEVLPDIICSRIIQNIMIPEFKQENYSAGIVHGAKWIINIIQDPEISQELQTDEDAQYDVFLGILLMLFPLFFVFLIGKALFDLGKKMVHVYYGLLTGKVSFNKTLRFIASKFIFSFVMTVFFLLPIIFIWVGYNIFRNTDPFAVNLISTFKILLYKNGLPPKPLLVLVGVVLLLVVVIPFFIAFLKKLFFKNEPFAFSHSKTDEKYIQEHLGSFNSFSSSDDNDSWDSSSDDDSFGGGGSSGGGGASGSW